MRALPGAMLPSDQVGGICSSLGVGSKDGTDFTRRLMDRYDKLFVFTTFFIQIALLVYFAIRKWNFDLAMRWGWFIYALALPAVMVSLVLLISGKSWYLWLAGFLYAVWAVFGYVVDIAHPIVWRSPVQLSVLVPYVSLYMAGLMFYWWPLGAIRRSLWFIYAVLFVMSTILNFSSHAK
jgi:hypothetical protein